MNENRLSRVYSESITNWWPHVLLPHVLLVAEAAAAAAVPAEAPRSQRAKEHHCPPRELSCKCTSMSMEYPDFGQRASSSTDSPNY